MLAKLQQLRRRGRLYVGPAAWSDDYSAVRRPGYYALSQDGKHLLSGVPLVCVDDAPGDHLDGACHYEYAGPRDYPQRSGGKAIGRGHVIEMEVEAEGRAEVST